MPITQERMIKLLDIFEEISNAKRLLIETAKVMTAEATVEFYQNDGPDHPLSSSLLANLQQLESLICQPLICTDSSVTIALERNHFETKKTHNARSARSMKDLRAQRATAETAAATVAADSMEL